MTGAMILQVLLIGFNAVFASAEIAVISMNDAKLRHLSQEGNGRAGKLMALTEQPAKFLATIQVAITMAGLLGGAFAADNFAGPLAEKLVQAGVPVPEAMLHSISVVLITVILTFFSLIFGELVPKRIAMKKSESLALGMAGMLYVVSRMFAPLVWLLTASTNGVLRFLGFDPEEEDEVVTEEEIRMLLAEGNQQGTIQSEEKTLIQNVFEFDDTLVEQLSTRRKDVVFLDLDDPVKAWEEIIQTSRFTYYPIFQETRDNIIGILDAKDYFRSQDRSREELLLHAVDEPVFVPEGMRANALFARMRQTRKYFAVILDEYGSVSGIVTLHDLLEALVGELEEEEAPPKREEIVKIREDRWEIQGSCELKRVSEELGVHLENENYDTFNGFIWSVLNRIPEDGETVTLDACGLKIEVQEVKGHVVEWAIVTKKGETKSAEGTRDWENG